MSQKYGKAKARFDLNCTRRGITPAKDMISYQELEALHPELDYWYSKVEHFQREMAAYGAALTGIDAAQRTRVRCGPFRRELPGRRYLMRSPTGNRVTRGIYGRHAGTGGGARASARWATGWRPVRCAPASRRSSGTASPSRPAISPSSARKSPTPPPTPPGRAAIVVTMVTDADAVMSIARDQGMLAALAPGAIWAQMSTIGVAGIERVAALVQAERPDVTLLDAPVSGSKDPAEHGQLTIFASGPDEARARVAPLFDALGQRTIWVGAVGAGSRLKLVNNTWLAFACRSGRRVDRRSPTGWGSRPRRSSTRSAPARSCPRGRRPSCNGSPEGEFSPQFALSLALKDVHLALEAADDDRFAALALSGRGVATGRRPGTRRPGPHRRDPRARAAQEHRR